MDVITEKPRPVVPHCGACCGASGPGQGAHAQYRPARSEAVTWPTGLGSSTRRRWQVPARLRDDVPNRRASHATPRDQTGLGSSTRRRWQGPARLRDRPLRAVRLACGDLAGGPPPTGASSSPAPQQDPTTPGTPAAHYHHPQTPPTDATHGRIKQPGPTAGSDGARNTSGPLPPPTDTARRCRPRAHQAARPHRHAPPGTHPETHHQTRARNTSGPTNTHQKQQKAGRNPSVPARPRYSATIGAARQVALRDR